MTRKELSQLYYLNKEIKQQQEQLVNLRAISTGTTSVLSDMPKPQGNADKIAKIVADIVDIQGLLECNIQKYYFELNRLNRYIQSLTSSEIRLILTYRYINCLTWSQVAAHISYTTTEESVKQIHHRFLKESC